MSFYLDTNILLPLHVREPQTDVLGRWIVDVSLPLAISDLAVAEFGAAIARYVRMKLISGEEATRTLARFDRWRGEIADPVESVPSDIRVAGGFVRRPFPKLLTADAIHIATCRRLGMTLVTHDRDMVVAAEGLNIAVLYPS